MNSSSLLDRRGFLSTTAVTAAGFSLGLSTAMGATDAHRRRVLRIAHLTDVHVFDQLNAPRGMAACLQHVQSQKDKPDLIFMGGDCIMDAFAHTRDETKAQWKIWHSVLKNECSLPVESCIGNHDVWGWDKKSSGATGKEMDYGKNWAVEALGLPSRYRSFDKAGWKIIVLDSTHLGLQPNTYTAKLDEEQFDWLKGQLKATPKTTPILILSHIPIFSAAAFLDGDNEKSGNWRVPGAWMHVDARQLTDLFYQQGNIQACLSGHLHMVDRVEFLGTSYLCNGAVCAGWWKGPYQQFHEGYALVDLFHDGTVDCAYVTYGWEPAKQSEKN